MLLSGDEVGWDARIDMREFSWNFDSDGGLVCFRNFFVLFGYGWSGLGTRFFL